MSGEQPEPSPAEPIIHYAVSEGEIRAHGEHFDLIAGTTFGSHQERWTPDGNAIDGQLNFRGGGVMGLDAAGLPIVEHQG